jgi:hypothetical protein
MKYLSSEPFSSGPSTEKYREGWDRIFGNKKHGIYYTKTRSISVIFWIDAEPKGGDGEGWWFGPGWYWGDETELLHGPCETREAAVNQQSEYAKNL